MCQCAAAVAVWGTEEHKLRRIVDLSFDVCHFPQLLLSHSRQTRATQHQMFNDSANMQLFLLGSAVRLVFAISVNLVSGADEVLLLFALV